MSKTTTPPPDSQSITQILAAARSKLQRLTVAQLATILNPNNYDVRDPTIVIDIRPAAQRAECAASLRASRKSNLPVLETIPGALIIERNVLEWRIDPQSDSMHPEVEKVVQQDGYDTRIVIYCQEGYTSSLAAAEAQRMGLRNATDLEGGFRAWCEERYL